MQDHATLSNSATLDLDANLICWQACKQERLLLSNAVAGAGLSEPSSPAGYAIEPFPGQLMSHNGRKACQISNSIGQHDVLLHIACLRFV